MILFGHFYLLRRGVISNQEMVFIFPILYFTLKIFSNCKGRGSFSKSQIKSLTLHGHVSMMSMAHVLSQFQFDPKFYIREKSPCGNDPLKPVLI